MYVGRVDSLSNFHVEGWAVEPDMKTAAKVAIEVDGEEIAVLVPTVFRQDLLNVNLAEGYAGFRFYFPDVVGAEKSAEIVVRRVSTGDVLDGPSVVTKLPSLYDKTASTDITKTYAASTMNTKQRAEHILDITAAVIIPRNAELEVVSLSAGVSRITDVRLHKNELTLAFEAKSLPADAPVPCGITFLAHCLPTQKDRYLVFDLVEKNPALPAAGCVPIGPAARFAVAASIDWMTFPPEENSRRTCGPGASDNDFANTGVSIAYQLLAMAQESHKAPIETILDWGVGCGRVATPFKRAVAPQARIIGLDVDKFNVDWCRANLPDLEVSQCDFFPPTQLASSSVDLIYGISVMTHLTEQTQLRWLAELRRILKPDGVCILSATTQHCLVANTLDPVCVKELYANGITANIVDGALGPLLALKDYYRATYQLWSQIKSMWSLFFDIVEIYPGAIGGLQDAIVMKRK
jgi:ubiquinone/menaquinone biosynthesis C-methylase UbiE